MRAYRALLRLFPASFRNEYGDEMTAIFAERRRQARTPLAVARLWGSAALDACVAGLGAHADLLRQDAATAVRAWRRAPGTAAMIALVAALGTGATATALAVTDHVLVRPLPFPRPDRLVKLYQDQSFRGYPRMELSPPNFVDWQRASASFSAMGAYTTWSSNLLGAGEPLRADGARVSGTLFAVLGVTPALGRTLTTADDRLDAPATLVISHALWTTRFGADPDVLGRSVLLDDEPHTIVGVMAPSFSFPNRDTTFWAPLRFDAGLLADRTNWYLHVVARLADDVSLAAARAEMSTIAARLAEAYPDANAGNGAAVIRWHDEVPREARLTLWSLTGASLGMLLIACVNVGGLLLARAMDRRHELSVRMALGAGRDRLIRQVLTENLLLTLGGGLAGVGLATVTVPLVARLVPASMPIAEAPAADSRLLALGLGISVAAAALAGVWPAVRLAAAASLDGLKDGLRAGVNRSTERLRGLLVIGQVSVSLVLVVCTGLLVQALWRVQAVDPGFEAANVLALRTSLPMPAYERTTDRERFYDRVLGEVRALPGVREAGYISFLPMVMRGGIWPVRVDGAPENPAEVHTASLRFVTPGFFEAMGIAVVEGRGITDRDRPAMPRVAVVSESFVRRHWPDRSPIGRQVSFAFGDLQVVGVVGDIRVRGLERESEPQLYLASAQTPDSNLIFYSPKELVVRATGDLDTLGPRVRAIVAAADPRVPVSDVRPLAAVVEDDSAARVVQVRVLTAFALAALALAAIGLHGLLAGSVGARTREFGVRLALGATRGRILRGVLARGLGLVAVGAACGGLAAWWAGGALHALLFGVSPTDAGAYAGAIAACLVVTLVGSLRPAWRAAAIDPIEALRRE